MPLSDTALAAIAALPTAEATAEAQSLCKSDRIVDAYMNRRALPRNDARYKRLRREQRRQQQLAELDARAQADRYGIRFDTRSGRWTLYLDNYPACTSTDYRALVEAYPELLHAHLVDALKMKLNPLRHP